MIARVPHLIRSSRPTRVTVEKRRQESHESS